MNILIFGAGAVGSTFGGFLSRTGSRICLYGRAWHLAKIRKNGLRVSGIWGNHTFRKFTLFTDLQSIRKSRLDFDLVLLTVKSMDTEKACRELEKIVSRRSVVLSLQNGLGNVECLHRHFPKKQVLAGRVIFGAVLGPGRVRVTVSADDVCIGETSGQGVTPRVREIASLFTRAGIRTVTVKDIRPHLWGKVLYNCALNPLASLLEVHYGALLENEFARSLMADIVREIYSVARKKKIPLLQKDSEDYRRLLFGRLIPATYAHHPSMLQDFRRGRATEIEALNGAVLRLGKSAGVLTPVNQVLTRLIKAKECGCGKNVRRSRG